MWIGWTRPKIVSFVNFLERIPLISLAGDLIGGYLPLVDDYFCELPPFDHADDRYGHVIRALPVEIAEIVDIPPGLGVRVHIGIVHGKGSRCTTRSLT